MNAKIIGIVFLLLIITAQIFIAQEKLICVNKYKIIKDSLLLNEKQADAYDEIVNVLNEKIREVIKDKAIAKYAREKQIGTIMLDINSNILDLLTSEQKSQFLEMIKDFQNSRISNISE